MEQISTILIFTWFVSHIYHSEPKTCAWIAEINKNISPLIIQRLNKLQLISLYLWFCGLPLNDYLKQADTCDLQTAPSELKVGWPESVETPYQYLHSYLFPFFFPVFKNVISLTNSSLLRSCRLVLVDRS